MFGIATYGSGRAITKTGIATPYMAAGSVIVTIAAGLLYTLDVRTSTGRWVGYQILAGFGYGLALQVPVVVARLICRRHNFARSRAIRLRQPDRAQACHHRTKRQSRPSHGYRCHEVHRLFSGAELDGVVHAYAWGIKVVFAITIAARGLTVPFSLCNEWANVNEKKPSGGGA
ncbi:Major facilitator superfamily domain general substrate transporter [Penicillium canescens]|nr:Major facilitator superfamily domain general substrate transporter [Penicillium canescens]